MTPVQQFALLQQTDTGDWLTPERLAPVLGSVGGLLMLVNTRDPLLRTAAAVLTAGSLFYGIATKPSAG